MPFAGLMVGAQTASTAVLALLAGGNLAGQVHSVYRQAANLLLADNLITLTLPSVGRLANGVGLEAEIDFAALGLRPGMLARAEGGRLLVPQAGLVVDLSAAAPWSPRWQGAPDLPAAPVLLRNLALAQRLAAAKPLREGFGPLLALLAPGQADAAEGAASGLGAVAYPHMVATLAALEAGEAERAAAAAAPLLGLGDGLTPSGDDFLVGLASALLAAGHPGASAFAKDCFARARGRTTTVSEATLRHAARGEFGERVQNLLHALLFGDESEVARRVSEMLAWGHSSGADCLLGILLGLAAARQAGPRAGLS
ncbi:MAG: oxamate carbamoyltransferase subunit AllH family protein [Chloroflexota bacterium]